MCNRKQIKNSIMDGPLAMDTSFSMKSVHYKGIVSDVADDADLLITPVIEAGNYTPITGHWELHVKSVEKHLIGDMKNFTIIESHQCLPILGEDQKRIVYIIDFWFRYAYYSGINGFIIIFTLVLSVLNTIVMGIKTFFVIKKPKPHAVNPNSGHCSSL